MQYVNRDKQGIWWAKMLAALRFIRPTCYVTRHRRTQCLNLVLAFKKNEIFVTLAVLQSSVYRAYEREAGGANDPGAHAVPGAQLSMPNKINGAKANLKNN